MSDKSKIEWTDASWPVTVGCDHVSEGCDHCYAATLTSGRLAHQPVYAGLAENGRFNGTVRCLPERLDWPLRWRKPRRIFVCSMADLFHEAVPDEFIVRVWVTMALAGQHTFQVLTKRHGRLRSLLNSPAFRSAYDARLDQELGDLTRFGTPRARDWAESYRSEWPLPNVWLGVSVENQKWADTRVPALCDTPAAVRFLSCEPLIGPVDLSAWMPPGIATWRCGGCHRFYSDPWQDHCQGCGREGYWCGSHTGNGRPNAQPLGWVIAGGESGAGARSAPPAWFRTLRDQCGAAGVPFFFKQWGAHRWIAHSVYDEATQCWVDRGIEPQRVSKKLAGRELDGRTWDEYPRVYPVAGAA